MWTVSVFNIAQRWRKRDQRCDSDSMILLHLVYVARLIETLQRVLYIVKRSEQEKHGENGPLLLFSKKISNLLLF